MRANLAITAHERLTTHTLPSSGPPGRLPPRGKAFVKGTALRTKRTLLNMAYALGSSLLLLLLGLVTRRLLVDNFGPQITTASQVVSQLFNFFSIAEFGVGSVISYRLYEQIAAKNEEKISKYMSMYKWAYRVVGLVIAGGLIFLLRRYWSGTKKRDRIHRIPEDRKKKKGKRKPPFWTRIALIVSAAGVAFSHGANDGQKGIGLVMLVLVGIAPAGFVVNMNASGYEITRTRDAVTNFEHYLQQHPELPQKLIAMEPPLPAASTDGTQVTEFHCHPANTFDAIARVKTMLPGNMESYEPLTVSQRSQLRRIMLCISDTSAKLAKLPGVSKEDQNLLKKLRSDMLSTIEYAPVWIIMAVALALGIGTMIGWRRVAMTIGEKIGKRGMTYAQGMAAQMTAAVSIGLASYIGMPVSTTHVLSSAVAGTMVVDGGGLQRKTVTSILMAWVFTLPAAIFLSGGLYWIALQLI